MQVDGVESFGIRAVGYCTTMKPNNRVKRAAIPFCYCFLWRGIRGFSWDPHYVAFVSVPARRSLLVRRRQANVYDD